MERKKKIFITGIAGAGKSTIAHELAKKGVVTIDIDHVPGLCGWVHNETEEKVITDNPDTEFMDSHDYKCDMNILKDMMKQDDKPVVVFGCVGDNHDFLPLFDEVLLMKCSPATTIQRLQTRNTNPFGTDIGVQKRILEWKKIFDEMMVDAGAVIIDAEQPIDAVTDDVMNYLR